MLKVSISTTNKLFVSLFVVLFPCGLFAQVYELPLNNHEFYMKIIYVNVPNISEQQYGPIFFYPSNNFIDKRHKLLSDELIKQTKDDISVYKFKHDRRVYDSYRFEIKNIFALHTADRRMMADSILFQVYARAYTRKWSVWHFGYVITFQNERLIYSGSFVINTKIIGTSSGMNFSVTKAKAEFKRGDDVYFLKDEFNMQPFQYLPFSSLNLLIPELTSAGLTLHNGLKVIYNDVISIDNGRRYFYTYLDLE